MKGRFNSGVPIDIRTLTAKERKIAFHEWAEGSVALEYLLNQGYKKMFLSLACCGGDTGHPYICYDLNDEQSRKMAMVIAKKLADSPHDCNITIYDNFLLNDSYPEIYPTRDITRLHVEARLDNKEEVFKLMGDTIKRAKIKDVVLPTSAKEIPIKEFKTEKQREIVASRLGNDLTNQVYSEKEIAITDIDKAIKPLDHMQNIEQNLEAK